MSYVDPNFVAPTSDDDVNFLFRVAGIECLRQGLTWKEQNDHANAHKWLRIHEELNKIGYEAEELCGVPDGAFGAGGQNKGGGGGG